MKNYKVQTFGNCCGNCKHSKTHIGYNKETSLLCCYNIKRIRVNRQKGICDNYQPITAQINEQEVAK